MEGRKENIYYGEEESMTMLGQGVQRSDEDALDSTSPENQRLKGKIPIKQHERGQKVIYSRGKWNNKGEYLLSLIGYTVGLSAIWRFPYLCLHNGGGAFLIPTVFFIVTSGFPMYFLELVLGQFSGKSPIIVWSICPLFSGLGVSMMIVSFIVTWYFNTMMSWILLFFYYSFYPIHPWSTCDNEWNTPNCRVVRSKASNNKYNSSEMNFFNNTAYSSINMSRLNDTLLYNVTLTGYQTESQIQRTSAEEFWRFKLLNISSGIHDFGQVQWHLVASLFVTNVLVFLCVIKGVKSVGKVVYITATMPYLLLCVLLVRSLTLEGSVDGVVKYFKPDFSKLGEFQVWLQAANQVFFSLGPAWGGVITMASYNNFHNNCWRDTFIVCVADGFSSLFGGLVVFSTIGFLAHEAGLSIEDASNPGPGLVFVAYPEVLARLPLPHLWAVIFFTMLIFVGIDSSFGTLETVISGIEDLFPTRFQGNKRYMLICALFVFSFSTGLIFTSQNAVYIYQVIDWYAFTFCVFFTIMLECVIVGWFYGAERFSHDIKHMLGRDFPIILRILICIVIPLFMLVAFCAAVISFSHPNYGEYEYPEFVHSFGVILGLLPIAPTVIILGIKMWKINGPMIKRLHRLLSPIAWSPKDYEAKKTYNMHVYEGNVFKIIGQDLFGHT